MKSHRHQQPIGQTKGALVWMLAGLVLALTLLTASPVLHAWLHSHDHSPAAVAHNDSGCAITLYQQGVTTPLEFPQVTPPQVTWVKSFAVPAETRVHTGPDHRLQPVRGPPCLG